MVAPLLVPLAMTVARHIAKKGITSALKTYKNRMSTAAIKQIGKSYKKINRKIDEKLTPKRTEKSIKRTEETNLKRKQAAEFTEKAAGRKIGSLTKKGQRRVGEGAKPQIKVSTKGNPRVGQTRKKVGLGVVGGAAGTAALMRDKKEPKGTTTKTKPTFKQAFDKARTNNQKTFQWQDKSGKVKRYTTEIAEEERKKFQAAGRGAGITRLGGNK
tara:strand:- start:585 stop:1226 length:642 start_codon:yes stop_codon:yes gene_type:complete